MTAVPYQPIDESHRLPPPSSSSRDIEWWGMAIVCASEGAFFAYLLTSYFYLALRSSSWPPAGIEKPELFIPLTMTVVLLSSSVALWWGERGIGEGRQSRLRVGISLAVFLGIVFLLLQWREYHEKLRHMIPQTHAYASIFFTTTGFHGAHVAFGVLLLLSTLVRAFRGHFDAARHTGVKVTSLYWHFVDGVWLVIVACLYISPRFY
jgi:heme/copper-type cytochrome/quinol oxidase subunit 3